MIRLLLALCCMGPPAFGQAPDPVPMARPPLPPPPASSGSADYLQLVGPGGAGVLISLMLYERMREFHRNGRSSNGEGRSRREEERQHQDTQELTKAVNELNVNFKTFEARIEVRLEGIDDRLKRAEKRTVEGVG